MTIRQFIGIIAGLVLAVTMARAEDAHPRQLVITRTASLDVPSFSHFGLPVPDNDDDLFFHLGDVFTDATIMKLAHSSWEPTLYKLPADIQHDKYVFYEFAVTPSGELWILANRGPELLAAEFDSHGQMTAKSILDLSLTDVKINDFAALDNDVLFFAGATVGKDAGRPFAALVDGASGKSIRTWHDVFSSAKAGTKGAVPVHAGNASVGDDGNIYLLNESEVVAINTAGEIVRRVKFVKPGQSLIPFLVRASAGYAAVWLRTAPHNDHGFEMSYLVLDLSSGKTMGWYAPPPDLKAPAMSFSRNNGFEFLVGKNGRLNLTRAELR